MWMVGEEERQGTQKPSAFGRKADSCFARLEQKEREIQAEELEQTSKGRTGRSSR